MPNWVRNRVIAKDYAELKKHLVDENGYVDFSLAIPKSKDLDITCGSYSYEIKSKYFHNEAAQKKLDKQQSEVGSYLDKIYNGRISQKKFVEAVLEDKELVRRIKSYKDWSTRKRKDKWAMSEADLNEALDTYIKGFFNLKRYGYKDWYDWSIANWGTKWNATTISVDDDTEAIEFDTAWSMPEPVFKAIAKHTPLRVLYADEDLGNNCGMEDYYVNENGEVEIGVVLEGSPELACDCWGYGCVDVYDNETGEQVEEDDTRFIEANKNYSAVQEEINLLMNTETIDKDFKEV